MKKLYSNITEIKIKGNPIDLFEVVTNLDKRIELLSNETSQIKSILFKYINSNAGKQYECATKVIHNLSKELYSSAEEINELQKQVCKYIEKCNEYDLRNNYSISPRRLDIEIVNIPSNVARIEYNEVEMKKVLSSLKNYVINTRKSAQFIINDKDNIGNIWKDRQYVDFSNEIDELVSSINKAIKVLIEYNRDLELKIKGLNS